jgi:hypothetical protein
VTLNFAKRCVMARGFKVVVTPGGIVGAEGEVLFDGAASPILVTSTTA